MKSENKKNKSSTTSGNSTNSTNWENESFRKAYNAEYAKRHPRVLLNENEYQEIKTAFDSSDEKKMGVYLKKLALSQIRNSGGVDEQAMKNDPFKIEQERQEREQDMIFLLRNTSNNINQIAKRLNTKALELKTRIVAGKKESKTILENCFMTLRYLETQISDYFKKTQKK